MNKERVRIEGMFDSIAHKYDFLNHLLSAGIDKCWRKTLCNGVKKLNAHDILDVATGTGDLALLLSRNMPAAKVTGVDISAGMLAVAQTKRAENNNVSFMREDALSLSFESGSFDAVTVAFGVRNFEDLEKGLTELNRVLRSGGKLFVLELSIPKNRVMRALYLAYFSRVLPLIGRLTSKNSSAYSYLYQSVVGFASGSAFTNILDKVDFRSCEAIPLSGGIATLYIGTKK